MPIQLRRQNLKELLEDYWTVCTIGRNTSKKKSVSSDIIVYTRCSETSSVQLGLIWRKENVFTHQNITELDTPQVWYFGKSGPEDIYFGNKMSQSHEVLSKLESNLLWISFRVVKKLISLSETVSPWTVVYLPVRNVWYIYVFISYIFYSRVHSMHISLSQRWTWIEASTKREC